MSQKNPLLRAGALLVAFFFLFNSAFASGLLSSGSCQKHPGIVYAKKTDSPGKSPFQFPLENKESEKETDDKSEKDNKDLRVIDLYLSLCDISGLYPLKNPFTSEFDFAHYHFAGHVPLFLANRVLLI